MPTFPEGQDPLDQGRAPVYGTVPFAQPSAAPAPTTGETISAAFRLNNPVVSVLDALSRNSGYHEPVAGYDAIPRLVGTKYEPLLEQSLVDQSPGETDARMAKFDSEQKDIATNAASGWVGVAANIVAGATDPSWFIPVFGEAHAAGEGLSIAARAARGAFEGALKSTVSEAALMSSQVTRTPREAVADIATNTLLMGLIGGGAGWLSRGEHTNAVDGLEAVRRDLSPTPETQAVAAVDGGAQAGGPLTLRDLIPAYEKARADQGGFSSVKISDVLRESGVPKEDVQRVLLEEAKAGNVTIHPTTSEHALADQAMQDAAIRIPGREEPLTHVDMSDAAQRAEPDRVPVEVAPSPRGLANDLSAASSDQRDMQLSRIGLPPSYQEAIRQVGAGKALDVFTAATMHMSPNLRVYSSLSLAAKRTMGDLVDTALKFTQAARGVTAARGGVTVERIGKILEPKFNREARDAMRDGFIAYRKMQGQKFAMLRTAVSDFRAADHPQMTWEDFNKAVYVAGTQADAHEVPEVAATAARIRAKIIDPIAQKAESVIGPDGKPMLSAEREPPKGDKSFMPRMWDKTKIAAGYNKIHRVISDWLEGEQARKLDLRDKLEMLQRKHENLGRDIEELDPAQNKWREDQRAQLRSRMEELLTDWRGNTTDEAIAALKARERGEATSPERVSPSKSADKAVDAAIKKILESDKLDLTRSEIEGRAHEILARINTAPDGRLPYDMGSGGPQMGAPGSPQNAVRGSLNARDFAIPSHLVQDFVHTDMQHVMSSFVRTTVPDIHLTERFGDVDMIEAFRKIDEDYAAAKTAAGDDAKKLLAIDAEHKAIVRDVAAMRDRVRHVYGWEMAKSQPNMARLANDAKNFNLLTDLGTSVFNRLNDATNAVWRHGLMNVFADGYMPFFKSLTGMEKDFMPAARQSMKDMQVGVDTVGGHLSHQFGDVLDNMRPGNPFQRALSWAGEKSMMVNLHAQWTDGIKTITGTAAAANFLRTAEKVTLGTASEADIAKLAQAGIEPFMARRIWESFKAPGGGETFNGRTHVANSAAWADKGAADTFAATIGQDADKSVLMPGMGEKALWTDQPVLSLIGQYHSFIMAAHEKLLISNLQQMDIHTLEGLIASIGMGMISYRAYTLWSGAPASDRPQDWIKEAISRSAMTGWLSEANAVQSKFTGGKSDMFRLIGADNPLSRRQTSSATADLLGSTYAKIEGIAGGVNDLSHGSWNAMDTHKLRQLMWFQNLFAIRKLLDNAEDGFNERLGVKPMNRDPSLWGPKQQAP